MMGCKLSVFSVFVLLCACGDPSVENADVVNTKSRNAGMQVPAPKVDIEIEEEQAVAAPVQAEVDHTAQEQLDAQRAELEEARQLQEDIRRELEAIRAELEQSDQAIQSKQQAINNLHSKASE